MQFMKKNYCFAGATVLMWATTAAVMKLMLKSIPDLEALFVTSLAAGLFLLILNLVTGKMRLLRRFHARDFLIMAALGFLGLFVYSALYYYGISLLSSQTACILNYLWPIMLVLFSCLLLKERMTIWKVAALLLSFAGVIVLSTGTAENGGSSAVGTAACILGAVCYGLYCVLNRKVEYDLNIMMMISWFTAAICGAIAGAFLETWVPIRGVQWAGMLWIGVVADAIAYLLWALALKDSGSVSVVANLAYLSPFLSLVFSALLLGEKITLRAIAALLLIVGGILLQKFFDR